MSFLSEIIVYIWLLPVASQVLLPLAILIGWSFNRLLSSKASETSMKKNSALSS